MKTLISTNNTATLSFAQAVLKDVNIVFFVLDQNVSVMDGSIGAIPRRLTVADTDYQNAKRALIDAGLGKEIST